MYTNYYELQILFVYYLEYHSHIATDAADFESFKCEYNVTVRVTMIAIEVATVI